MDRDGRTPLLVRTPIVITIDENALRGGTSMKKLLVAAVSLGMGLAGVYGGALAQTKDAPIITGNIAGNCITSPSVTTTGANAGDWSITCGDISPGSGLTVIGPPSIVSEPAPVVAPEPVVAPASEPAPVAADTTVASATDADGDNYDDAQELAVGLDPTNPDADGDGVADGDEVAIYFTDPWVWDTDGDGISDGEELFGILTNPLVWDTDGDGVRDGEELPV
jgi:hypothetical protein